MNSDLMYKELKEKEELLNKEIEEKKALLREKERNLNIQLDKTETVIEKPTNDFYVDIGYKIIPLLNLPSKGRFYPDGISICIRPLTVGEVRHFSTIDESDNIDINSKLDYILEQGTLLKTSDSRVLSYKYIKDIDRFYLIFAIRELTFINGENELTMDMPCPNCGKTDKIKLTKERFNLFKQNEILEKYYDSKELGYTIKTKTEGQFTLYLPSVGTRMFIRNFNNSRLRNNQHTDTSFLRFAPYLFRDWSKLTNETYEAEMYKSLSWTTKKLSLIVRLIDILENSSSTKITKICSCGTTEVTAPITFQGGIKSIFIIPDIISELL